jgi:hypothetical protein
MMHSFACSRVTASDDRHIRQLLQMNNGVHGRSLLAFMWVAWLLEIKRIAMTQIKHKIDRD